MDYTVSEDQKLKYFHNLFDKDATQFFCKNVQIYFESSRIEKGEPIAHFSNISRQNSISKYMQTITLQCMM